MVFASASAEFDNMPNSLFLIEWRFFFVIIVGKLFAVSDSFLNFTSRNQKTAIWAWHKLIIFFIKNLYRFQL